MRVTVKKVFRGAVEVKDYQIERAKALQEDLEIVLMRLNEEIGRMRVPLNKLDTGVPTIKQHSIFNNSTYTLIAFRWRPEKVNEEQGVLF